MGTPAYMSPEQFLGEEITAKSDQFALCVALWEGLWGERPFAGTTTNELARNVTGGHLREVDRSRGIPTWLKQVLLRGLSPGAEARFDSVETLLAALENDPSRRRGRIVRAGAAAALVAVIALGIEGGRRLDRARTVAGCETDGASIDTVWNPEASDRVREALLATGVSYAASTAAKVTPWLDGQAQAWRAQRTDVCMRADVEHSWDSDTVDRSLWCLDERRLELASLVAKLEHADAGVVATAMSAAVALTPISPCLDATVLANLPPPPPAEDRDAVAELRGELARARALFTAGTYGEALEVARSSREQAALLLWPPLTADAMTLEGKLLAQTGAHAEAESVLVAGYIEAAQAGAWAVAANAAQALVDNVGTEQVRLAEGRVWAIQAQVAAQHAGDPLGLHEIARIGLLGQMERLDGRYAEAARLHERAVTLVEQALGPDHPAVADALTSLANDDYKLGEFAEGAAVARRALAIYERTYGPEHPKIAASLNNVAVALYSLGDTTQAEALYLRALAVREAALGPWHSGVAISLLNLANVYVSTGEPVRALPLFERTVAINERAFGPDHPEVAGSLNNVGLALTTMGEHGRAVVLHERALAIRVAALGPEHPEVAKSLSNLANSHAGLGNHAEAKALQLRALAIREKSLGAEHPDIARSLSNLANAHQSLGEYAQARPLYERALAIREKALGPAHLDVVYPLIGLASLARAELRFADAARLAERAIHVREAGNAPAPDIAEARYALAQALWDAPDGQGRDRERAMQLATNAAELLASAKADSPLVLEVASWLAAHGAQR